jgi:hypothetical protein
MIRSINHHQRAAERRVGEPVSVAAPQAAGGFKLAGNYAGRTALLSQRVARKPGALSRNCHALGFSDFTRCAPGHDLLLTCAPQADSVSLCGFTRGGLPIMHPRAARPTSFRDGLDSRATNLIFNQFDQPRRQALADLTHVERASCLSVAMTNRNERLITRAQILFAFRANADE